MNLGRVIIEIELPTCGLGNGDEALEVFGDPERALHYPDLSTSYTDFLLECLLERKSFPMKDLASGKTGYVKLPTAPSVSAGPEEKEAN